MIKTPIALLGMAGALALGLAACGGSSSGGSTTTSASTAPATSTAAQTTPAQTQTSSQSTSADGANGLTPPGTKLGFGTSANVGWVPPSRPSGSAYRLQVTVKSIVRGSIDDFKNISLDASQKSSTPYYVSVSVKALEDVQPGTDDPDISFDAIDDRGQQQESVTFLGTFQRCNDTQVPRPFPSGKSYDSCLTYLMPGGGSIDSVQWRDGPSRPNDVTPYFDKPIVWSGS